MPRTGRKHERTEERRLSAVAITGADNINFHGAAQILQIVRYTSGLDGPRLTKEVDSCITRLTREQAGAATLAPGPQPLPGRERPALREDRAFGEDASRARTGHLLAVLSAIRNTVTSALPLAGETNIGQARRWTAGSPERAFRLFSAAANHDIGTQ